MNFQLAQTGKGWCDNPSSFTCGGISRRPSTVLQNVPEDIRDPRFFAYRAHLLLAVGRVDEAGADIERALRLAPNDSNALALQTIIAVVQNEPDKALHGGPAGRRGGA